MPLAGSVGLRRQRERTNEKKIEKNCCLFPFIGRRGLIIRERKKIREKKSAGACFLPKFSLLIVIKEGGWF